MSLNPESAHIQSGLTISDASGLFVDIINERTLENGIITSSSLKTNKDITFLGISGDASIDLVVNDFIIKNDIGMVDIKSLGGKGINIASTSGNVFINSTTDSIDLVSGSLITEGGAVVKKTLNVGENINCNDLLSTFTNTTINQQVIEVKNESSSGYSSIAFLSDTDLAKLEIGYGNSTVSAPLTGTSYISSKSGSELLFRADSNDSFNIKTNGSVDFFNTFSSSSSTTGSLRLLGGIGISNTTDASSLSSGGSFTSAGGMSIGKKLFIGDSVNFTSITEPVSVNLGITSVYVDTADNLLKSKNNSGTVTIYQPTNTKGDLVTHNGTVALRLPVGVDGYTLVANSTTSTGLEWKISSGGTNSSSNKYTLIDLVQTTVIEQPYGCNIFYTYPRIKNGSSCTFFTVKSSANLGGVVSRFNSNTSLTNSGTLLATYEAYIGVEINKTYIEGNGDYIGNSNDFDSTVNISLSGTSWVNFGTELIGALCLSINSESGGPCATFIVSKSIAILNNGSITRIISSPGSGSGTLRMRWPSNGVPQISKSNSGNDGAYQVNNNFQDTTISTTVTLSGTNRSIVSYLVFGYYTCKSFLVKITSTVDGRPCGIFSVSKNSVTRIGNVSRYRSPGSTGELLNVHWDSTSLFEVSKNGVASDGIYTVLFTKLT
jgi:hypothetical protein